MSQILIQKYLNDLSDLRRASGEVRESVVREAFKTLLKDWGRSKDLIFIPEYKFETSAKDRRYADGALLHELRVPFGYWEAKDEKDDLDDEIATKFRRGYPQDNIIFEDSRTAVLIQNRNEIVRCDVTDPEALEKLLNLFFGYERKEISNFRKAVEQFKTDLPAVLDALREMIDKAHREEPKFKKAAAKFLKHAQETINPSLTDADVREMLIQHILTEEIFSKVFDESEFHQHNNVARELYALEGTFFTGGLKKTTLKGLESYYAAIRAAAAQISNHHEKQTFLKVIYENFYKVYNKKAADRLGVVYTPNEIVRFMIESADWLCQQHFGKRLIDKHVEILDPAAGTGTFITELIEHFRGQPAKLKHKYMEELHANEVAILPYYVANLNIEASYAAITGEYEEFQNLCFVDTLDNVAALGTRKGQHVGDLFGAMSEENVERIKRQNRRKISVVIGNPPYNANQLNENENNKNRDYPDIDRRIKESYIKASTAQKTKLYDMYARFFRWASDRVADDGIVAFISNRSFIESRTFDGFRKMVAEEFNDIYVVDLGGDVRADPRLSGTKHNVFGIQTGVAISFMVKRHKAKGCRIRYVRRPQMETAEEKLAFLDATTVGALRFDEVEPSEKNDWINLSDNDFGSLIPIGTKETKSARVPSKEKAIFKLYSLGVATNRDDWVYDFDRSHLSSKVRYLVQTYNDDLKSLEHLKSAKEIADSLNYSIKWTRAVKRDLARKIAYVFDERKIVRANYRPFISEWLYRDEHLNEMGNLTAKFFHDGSVANRAITIMGDSSGKPYFSLAIDRIPDLNFVSPASGGSQTFARSRLEANGSLVDNITDWALKQFRAHYEKGEKKPKHPITKDAIFHYVYGVLHDPVYREKYAQNLKREFPRIPFYADFWKWSAWGEALMALHIGYEAVEPWPLERIDVADEKSAKAGLAPKAMLKADKDAGNIQLDSETQLTGIPPEAWDYKLGNRSALEWILDQYKEKKPKDLTIREKFNTYRFADYKETVVDLLKRVTRVSVETQAIVEEMKAARDAR
ncbi:MAG: type ISP restriction/modification enzyme [Parvibaculum sp.]|uniref:type ISP restriction/modification enzyme n=1 Tax=Parvibaculum sp. TaxID=2024848 RepID=UPI0027288FA1|nr:type ISP restriction/modification enzyme [Parvibaculum sp.]MDO8839625.1 type ISP restriction/modification enzyme [Parvibaculum sp.]